MKLFRYKGLSMVIMLRDEHCPPHAHVDAGAWSARFKFCFWHNGVELWDVVPHSNRPPAAVLEGLRHALRQPAFASRPEDLVGKAANGLSRSSDMGLADQRSRRGEKDYQCDQHDLFGLL